MTLVLLDLGTNVDRERSLVRVFQHLAEEFTLRRCSSIYRSKPVGILEQPDFFNLAVEIETDRSVDEIKTIARGIEDKMGRDRTQPKFGPRNIDIDVVCYGDLVDEKSRIPHELSTTELFVVAPIAELYPDGVHPKTGETWRELKERLMAGRTPAEAGIVREAPIDSLALCDSVRLALTQA